MRVTDLAFQCRALGLPVPEAEFRFHPVRRWRFDWAWVEQKIALEVDGGVFLPGGGRHSRGAGYRADCEKLAEASILGWRVLRVLPEHVKSGQAVEWIRRIVGDGHGQTWETSRHAATSHGAK